jgi:hypothetical protein
MAYATPTDVEARLGRTLDESEAQIVQARLGDAELIIKSRIPDLDTRITDGTLLQEALVMVESDMVLRLVKNPDGYAQETDGNYSYTLHSDIASGRLSVLPHEWALLGIRGGVFTITPYMQMPWEVTP